MGLLDFFKERSIQKKTVEFYADNGFPDFPASQGDVHAYLSKHPGWRQLPPDVLAELSSRVADRSRRWITYDVDHALEILVYMTEKSNALIHNFIPICRDENTAPMDTPEAKLYLFAMTFEKLASKYICELQEKGDRLTAAKLVEGLEDAKAYAEAALICDRYFLTAFPPAAWAWVMKDGDVDRAVQILDEGIDWAMAMGRARPHKASFFDEQFIKEPEEHVQFLEETIQGILNLNEPEPEGPGFDVPL